MHLTVGIDGSGPSSRALIWAVDEAAQLGCDLEIIHAPLGPPATATIDVADALASDAYGRELLNSARNRAADRNRLVRTWSRYELGPVADVLLQASRRSRMLVLGSRHRERSGMDPGPTITRLVTEAPCPVCVVPDRPDLPEDGPVVVGVDDSGCGLAAMRLGRAEAGRRDAVLRAVRAYEVRVPGRPADDAELRTLHRAAAKTAMTVIDEVFWLIGGIEPDDNDTQDLVQEGRPAEVIIGSARDAQLIIVGSHGRGFVRRLLLGSVSRQVLNDADVPVLVIKRAVQGDALTEGLTALPRPGHARPDAAGPDTARSDGARTDAARSDAARSDAARSDAARSARGRFVWGRAGIRRPTAAPEF